MLNVGYILLIGDGEVSQISEKSKYQMNTLFKKCDLQ